MWTCTNVIIMIIIISEVDHTMQLNIFTQLYIRVIFPYEFTVFFKSHMGMGEEVKRQEK